MTFILNSLKAFMAGLEKFKLVDSVFQRVKAEAFNTVSSDSLRHDHYNYLTRLAKWYTLKIKHGQDELKEIQLMKMNIKTTIG